MTHLLRSTAICGALLAALPAMSQDIPVGGQVDLDYRTFDDLDLSTATLRLSGEIPVSRQFSLQGDLSISAFDLYGYEDSFNTVTVHGIQHISATSSVGGFLTYDSIDDDALGEADMLSVGIEAGGNFAGLDAEIWFGLGRGSVDGDDFVGSYNAEGVFFGMEAKYPVGRGALIGKFEHFNFDGVVESSQLGVGFEVSPTPFVNVRLMAETSDVGVDYFDADFGENIDDTSYSLGATFKLGKRPGTVFGSRSIMDAFR